MSKIYETRWRSRLAVALVAAAVPSVAGTAVAGAAPSAQARLTAVAAKAPARKVTAIVQFKAGLAEKQAKTIVRAHGGKVVSRVPLINGLAVQLPAKEAKALAAEPQGRRPHAQHPRPQHGPRQLQARHVVPEDHEGRQALAAWHHGRRRRRRGHRHRRRR